MRKYGCVGKKLTHSFSREIHSRLADYKYELIELDEEEMSSFFTEKKFEAVNVTIPYKQSVMSYLDVISEKAKKIGAVNTVVNKNGTLYGYNTDYYGIKALVERAGLDLSHRKVLILGSGGTSKTAREVSKDLGASEILIVSRKNKAEFITYEEAATVHSDAQIIINTTPVGMYPDCDSSPIDLSYFGELEGVIDVVCNPLSTNLILDARSRGIKAEGGLYMLVMQAAVAVEKFLGSEICAEKIEAVYRSVLEEKENIVLVGMPGSGKSTVGKLINLTGYTLVDTDAEIEARCGTSIKELISTKGEKYFRDLESEVIRDVSSRQSLIISTGGGAVLREENVTRLKHSGKIFFLDAPLSRLCATSDRPLSDTEDKLKCLYDERIDIYRAVSEVVVPDMTPEAEAEFILEKRRG
ncbi:MAG: shikimate dehydrogenase [Clostridia bacterium]|nr:shikimate dehydrogenase [Clostridia bacterium]